MAALIPIRNRDLGTEAEVPDTESEAEETADVADE